MEFDTPEEYWQYEMIRQRLLNGVTHAAPQPDPAPEPRPTTEEEAVDPDQEIVLVVKDGDGMTAAPGPEVPPAPLPPAKRKRPTSVYVTESEAQAIRLLRQHPEGLTSAQIALIIGKSHDITVQVMSKLRASRPYKGISTPLVTRIGRKYLVTTLGRHITLKTTDRPTYFNRQLGWHEEF